MCVSLRIVLFLEFSIYLNTSLELPMMSHNPERFCHKESQSINSVEGYNFSFASKWARVINCYGTDAQSYRAMFNVKRNHVRNCRLNLDLIKTTT
jgi:hypothetical protein